MYLNQWIKYIKNGRNLSKGWWAGVQLEPWVGNGNLLREWKKRVKRHIFLTGKCRAFIHFFICSFPVKVGVPWLHKTRTTATTMMGKIILLHGLSHTAWLIDHLLQQIYTQTREIIRANSIPWNMTFLWQTLSRCLQSWVSMQLVYLGEGQRMESSIFKLTHQERRLSYECAPGGSLISTGSLGKVRFWDILLWTEIVGQRDLMVVTHLAISGPVAEISMPTFKSNLEVCQCNQTQMVWNCSCPFALCSWLSKLFKQLTPLILSSPH